MKIVLGSASPRRQNLLKELGYNFEVLIPTMDEIIDVNIPIEEVAADLAKKKALHLLSQTNEETLLICADTIVLYNGTILGKPKDREEALKYLSMLSGNEHQVITGVVLMHRDKILPFSETTHVKFKKLSKEEISHYVDNYHPYDKAGAYGIQDWIGLIGVESINGSYTNVMGLPSQQLNQKILSL